MATYNFKAMDLAGVRAKGEVEAVSKQAVVDQLKERGLIVIDVAHKYRSKELNIDLFARVKANDLAIATRQLSTMVSSGMTILRALYVLEAQSDSKLLKETLQGVRQDVEAGLLLSEIGRASCRERVEIWVVDGGVKKKERRMGIRNV